MSVVWKFELRPYIQTISMPVGATVLAVGNQEENVVLWALCDPDAPVGTRSFTVAATGEPFDPSGGTYRGTVLLAGGSLVFHVWEGSR